MTETIFAAALGFVTIPLVILVITGFVASCKWVGGLGLPLSGYWSGFGLFVGMCMLTGGGAGLYTTLTR